MIEPEVHALVARNPDRYSREFREHYLDLHLLWRRKLLHLDKRLAETLTQRIPLVGNKHNFPLTKCSIAGIETTAYTTKAGRLYKQDAPIIITEEWKDVSNDVDRWTKAWARWKSRPSEPKHRTLLWRLMKHKIVTGIITSKWTGDPNTCKRCSLGIPETIAHAFLDCPAIAQLWQRVDETNCRIIGIPPHESTREDRLFGQDKQISQRFNEVVALSHDIALWIIYRSRLELVLDDVQPNPVAITKQFDHELQRGIKSKWWMAMKHERKRDFIDKWSRGNWVNIIDDSVIFTQDTSEDQIPAPTPA
ncbi:uncharacterized protein VTP21DRAFT_8639 [Calcarisporiella thermophila]|uniref:uncharacterized protein n=1 Tax=Calcarisporiella thermophila TaxID=911321 RepID=UPI003742E46B